jgi:ribosomal protein S4
MPRARRKVSHKHFQLNNAKIRRAQKVLRAKTETETIERALDAVIAEDERNRLANEAHERFLQSGIVIKDVFGVLD